VENGNDTLELDSSERSKARLDHSYNGLVLWLNNIIILSYSITFFNILEFWLTVHIHLVYNIIFNVTELSLKLIAKQMENV